MIYTILKNWHYSLPPLSKIYYNKDVIEYEVILDSNIWHEARNKDDKDISKIVGVAYGIFQNRRNSIRIGFIRNDVKDIIDIYYYAHYNNTKHFSRFLKKINVKKNNKFRIKIKGLQSDDIEVYVDDCKLYTGKNDAKRTKLMFGLKPYEGGDNKAHHNYTTKIHY